MDTSYLFLLDLALILLSTKVLGLFTRKFNMPQVVGALMAGLLLGPAMFNFITETEFIADTAEIGVIVLMFCAGLETDVDELKKCGKASFVIALCGIIVPLLGGLAVGHYYTSTGRIVAGTKCSELLQNIFLGVILTATSVSITVETLREMGKLKTAAGSAILGAAIIDDILGIIALTVVMSMADSSVNVFIVLAKIVGFFIFLGVVGVALYFVYTKILKNRELSKQRYVIVVFVFCLLLSFIAESGFGVADITGAFFAGVMVSCSHRTRFIGRRFGILSYLYLSPMFFASIGLKVELKEMNRTLIIFTIVLGIVAILTKVVGCGLGALLCKYSPKESLQIGTGMISRGEVALIVASKGASKGLISEQLLGPVVIVVVITTIITPILLKMVFHSKEEKKVA